MRPPRPSWLCGTGARMSLEQHVQTALAALPTPAFGPLVIDEHADGLHLECQLSAIDSLGCAFEKFVVTSDRLQAAAIDELKRVADELTKRLTYLLEPIAPIEIDRIGCTVQLRSVPPSKDGDRTSYYEILVQHGGQLSLARYGADYGAGRQVILAQVTREVFLRVVRDFAAAAH